MSLWTPMNLEYSAATYLANQLNAEGFEVYFLDSRQSQGSGSVTVTLLRDFPADPANLAAQNGPTAHNIINIPAFAVFASNPRTSDFERLGIGESVFDWEMTLRVDGFVDTELQWYNFHTFFKDWFAHPDIQIDFYDQELDVSDPTPPLQTQKVRFENTDVIRSEVGNDPATRYYLSMTTTARFIE